MSVEFRLLGPLEVVVDSVSLQLGGPRLRALLAALLVENDHFVSRDRLIDELWGDEPPITAENALQAQVAALRRLLPGRIETDGTTYRLMARSDEVDARRFEAAVSEAHTLIERQPRRAAAQLATALKAWRGPALDGAPPGSMAGAEATRLDALRRAAYVDRADACLVVGENDKVVGDLAGLVARDPTDEQLAAKLMLAQYRSAGSGAAIATFDRLAVALERELGVAPDVAVVELRRAIDRHDPTLAGPIAGLPLPTTRFVGRERDLQEAMELLQRSRLLTLVGPGGSGKSRLSLELARSVAGTRVTQVHVILLAALPTGGSVTRLIAEAIGVRERRGESLAAGIVARLRSQQTLLILDNCEHVLPIAANLSVELLEGAPSLRIVATSREPLGAPGEVSWPVPGLELPPKLGSDAEILAADSMRLLLDRGRAARPGFELAGSDVAWAAALCRRLDGLPLAIELAAARLKSLSLRDIVERLETRQDLPARLADTAEERHRTMRAAINWSYELLSVDERRLLRSLSVFQGTLDTAGALAVWGDSKLGDDPFASLSRLVDQSMVVAVPAVDGPTAYRLLETIRQDAAERLAESGETGIVRSRHADWCAALIEAARDWGGSEQETSLARLDASHNDVLAAMTWLLGDGARPDAALAMAANMWWYWYLRGLVAEGLVWLRRTLAATGPESSSTRAVALRGASALSRSSGDYAEAMRLGDECLEMCRALDDRAGVAGSLNSLCATALAMGRVEDAVRYGEASLAAIRGSGNQRGLGASLTNLGTALRNLDRFAEAEAALSEAAGVFHVLGDVRGEISAIINRAIVEQRRGRFGAARNLCLEALRLCVFLGHAEGEVDCLDVVATIDVAEGNMVAGLRLFDIVDSARRRLGLEVSTPDERRDREAAIRRARSSLAPADLVLMQTASRQTDLTTAAIAVLDSAVPYEPLEHSRSVAG